MPEEAQQNSVSHMLAQHLRAIFGRFPTWFYETITVFLPKPFSHHSGTCER